MAEMPRLEDDGVFRERLSNYCAGRNCFREVFGEVEFLVHWVLQVQRELLRDYVELPAQEQLEKELDVLLVYDDTGEGTDAINIPLSAERIIEWLRGKE